MGAMEKQKRVLISAGGTGGHVSPAAALADDLIGRGFKVALITDNRGARYKSMFTDVDIHVVKSGTAGAGVMGKVKGALNLGVGILQAFKLVKLWRPDLAIGFGGYPSVPGVFAAQKLGVPTILHEQNAIIGRANAFLAPKADRIALSLPSTTGLDKDDQMRGVITGNPVRAEISALAARDYDVPVAGGEFRILVMGGSLGATILSDVIPEALAQLPEDYRARLKVVQQCRKSDIEAVRLVYEDAGIDAVLNEFFDNVAEELGNAHLFIGRSGASTVAEASVAGCPAIYVPLMVHKDGQQKRNADVIADQGGAWVMAESGFTCEALLAKVETLMHNPESLAGTAKAAKACGKSDAARKLGNLASAIMNAY